LKCTGKFQTEDRKKMRIRWFRVPTILLAIGFAAVVAATQDSSSTNSGTQITSSGERKILRQMLPRYPDLARRLSLAGNVKVVAVVTPEGKVKKIEPVGGSPLLMQAAQEAIYQWKFAPAPAESREVVEFHFNP
jgi:TonB family protein